MDDPWLAIAGLAAAVQAAVVVFAAYFGLQQVRESRRTRAASILFPLFVEFENREASDARYRLFHFLPEDLTTELNREDSWTVYQVVRQLDFMGYLVDRGVVEFDLIAPYYAKRILDCWERTHDYVRVQRQRNNGSAFADHLEVLAKRCSVYAAKRGLSVVPDTRIPDDDRTREEWVSGSSAETRFPPGTTD